MQNSGREEPVPTETGPAIAAEILPGVDPSIFMGDLRAGDGARTVKTIELCRDRGVLPFSTRYTGGEGGGEAGKGAAAAADFEYEDVSTWKIVMGNFVYIQVREEKITKIQQPRPLHFCALVG